VVPSTRIHVRFTSRHGWAVQREGLPAPISIHCSQALAERAGRTLAQRDRGRLFVHDFVGAVIRTDSFADPA
jgi:hypothetical protein